MLQVVDPEDPRIHFALVCGAKSCPPIKVLLIICLRHPIRTFSFVVICNVGRGIPRMAGTLLKLAACSVHSHEAVCGEAYFLCPSSAFV